MKFKQVAYLFFATTAIASATMPAVAQTTNKSPHVYITPDKQLLVLACRQPGTKITIKYSPDKFGSATEGRIASNGTAGFLARFIFGGGGLVPKSDFKIDKDLTITESVPGIKSTYSVKPGQIQPWIGRVNCSI